MNTDQLNRVLGKLHGAYPSHPWSEAVDLVWAEKLLPLEPAVAGKALDHMIERHPWPSLSDFQKELHPTGPIVDGARRYLPGSGWLGEANDSESPSADNRAIARAPEPPPRPDKIAALMAEAKANAVAGHALKVKKWGRSVGGFKDPGVTSTQPFGGGMKKR